MKFTNTRGRENSRLILGSWSELENDGRSDISGAILSLETHINIVDSLQRVVLSMKELKSQC